VTLEARWLCRETPTTEVVRNGVRFAGIRRSKVLEEQARAAGRLRPVALSSGERQTRQLLTDALVGGGNNCNAAQLGHPRSLTRGSVRGMAG